ncbi:MAG: Rrf2 family transcriptional regulator [Candidatus Omnitrophica bacterium]|nr:Rrf2 family transcriptional regulator [Candidatus Omnitrophota bacterium]MCM8791418.1 Rrf2 family transcriptional regulator [Candidatus Omnitrophota bacterium]
MKITYKGDYALKAIFQLALHYGKSDECVMSISEIAKLGDMPVKFLEQILLALRRGGFVKSRRGVKGGFLLARHPKEIKVGEVIRFMEGPIEPIACVEKESYKGCKDVAGCIFRDIWKEVKNSVCAIVDALTFEDLIIRYKEKSLKKSSMLEYNI